MTNSDLAGGRLTIDLEALVANWRNLDTRSRPGKAAAVVKADAYGLGVEHVVPALAKAGCDTFFVALPAEALTVRAMVRRARIFVFNGVHQATVQPLRDAGIIPVLADLNQAEVWRDKAGNAACAIQVDTGMNRLGLSIEDALTLKHDNALHIVHVLSHFACADEPEHPMNRRQIESFQRVMAAFDDVESSFSNSAATLWGGALGHSVTRPGIAIYGGEAINDTPNRMRPVVKLNGRIAQLRHAPAGETISYGATQTLSRDTTIATVSVGYADGYPRSASGAGVPFRKARKDGAYGSVGGHRVPLLGRITMDLTMFDVTDVPQSALETGWIELIGPEVPLDDVARAAGTIGYEILTNLGSRYQRRNVGGSHANG